MSVLSRDDDGFTIPELLATLFVLSIAFLSFSTLYLTIRSVTERTSDFVKANSEAFAKMQEYENQPFSLIPVGTGPDYEVEDFSDDVDPELLEPEAKVRSQTISPTLKYLEVEVEFLNGDSRREIIYASYIQISGVGR
jgi:prepilin-type N-terminal cleavage/methylation domain-containing protein